VTHGSDSPANPGAEQTVTVTATVRNQGTGAIPLGIILGIGYDDDAHGSVQLASSSTSINSLAVGSSVTLTTHSNWIAASGSYLRESNERHNTLSKTVVVP
jgi:hypothetical protein